MGKTLSNMDLEVGKRVYRACCFSLDCFMDAREEIMGMVTSQEARDEATRQLSAAERDIGEAMEYVIWGPAGNPWKRGDVNQIRQDMTVK